MTAIGPGWWQCTQTDEAHPVHHVHAGTVYYCGSVHPLRGFPDQVCSNCGQSAGGRLGLVLQGVTSEDGAWCPCIFKPLGGSAVTETREFVGADA